MVNKDIKNMLIKNGYEKILNEFEKNGYQFFSIEDKYLFLMDSLGRFYGCF